MRKKKFYKVLSLFSGIGGLCHHGIQMARTEHNFKVVQFVENSAHAQNELRKLSPKTPIHADVCDYHVDNNFDIICGGFPCAGTSDAGDRLGLLDPRSGLWHEHYRIIKEAKEANEKKGTPAPIVLIENPPGLLSRGIGTVVSSLERLWYVGEWCCINGDWLGLPHERKRLFIIAYPYGLFKRQQPSPWTDQIRTDIEEAQISWDKRIYQPGISAVASRISVGVPKGIKGNFDARRAYGLSCSPRQAAIAWLRIDYLLGLVRG